MKHSAADPEHREMVEKILPMLTSEKRAYFERHAIDVLVMPYQLGFAEPIVTPIESNSDPRFVEPPPSLMAPNVCRQHP